jgi:precorrin-6A/cobalt-precorrin-6A reductase
LIWIIGGTSEASELVNRINRRRKYIISVATYAGYEMLQGENVVVSRLSKEEMIQFIKDNNINLVVDMTHPYAVEVTNSARHASSICNVRYIRFVREKAHTDGAIYIDSLESCIEYIEKISGCVFFTTGIKNIKDFEKVKGKNRFVYRILPTKFSIDECMENNILMKDIVAILGPASEELNIAMFKEFKADYVVMKDSGENGGTLEKISACMKLGIKPIVIGRKEEEGISNLEKLLEMILCCS